MSKIILNAIFRMWSSSPAVIRRGTYNYIHSKLCIFLF